MFSKQIILLAFGCLIGQSIARSAPQYNDNPTNVVAVADFPQGGKKVAGTMKFFSTNGTVKVHWDVTKLPAKNTPFYYHIHEKPVGSKGKCSSTGKRLNPNNGPKKCESVKSDDLCQVGDLSGKHGWIATTCFETSYYDPYLSLNPDDESYVVGKSIVLHYPNSKKMACADIVLSSESVKHADRESKRNVKHNKDLVEAQTPNWKPANKEEAKLIEDSHKEWLKYNKEGDVHRDSIKENPDYSEFEKLFVEDVDFDDEDLEDFAAYEAAIAKETNGQKILGTKKLVENKNHYDNKTKKAKGEGYEPVVPEHHIDKLNPWDETTSENNGHSLPVNYLLGGLATLFGFII